jgi:phosphatidylglycerol---prolipoprotein diacylglyceryl transferase
VFVWNIDPNLFHLPDALFNGRGIRYYGLLFAAALMGGYYLFQWQMVRAGRRQKDAERFLTPAVISIIVGVRLAHCLFYQPEIYLKNPIKILYFWEGGLASHGAVIGLVVCFAWYSKKVGMPFREVLDRTALSGAFAATMIRLGNFMNSEIVGRASAADFPLRVKFPRHDKGLLEFCDQCGKVARSTCDYVGEQCYSFANVPWRHASQLYEAAWGIALMLMLWGMDRKWGEKNRPLGALGGFFFGVYFLGRILIENVKEYQARDAGLTMGQLLSVPVVIGGFGLFAYALIKRPPTPPVPEEWRAQPGDEG